MTFPRSRFWRVLMALFTALVLSGGAPSVAHAATCSATVSPMNFGSLGFLTGPVDTSSTIQVTCQSTLTDTSSTLHVCPLIGPSLTGGTSASRTLSSSMGHPSLRYGLYSDTSRSTPWGDQTSPPYPSITLTLPSSGSSVTQLVTVYGRVAAPQTPYGNDTYRDLPIVSLAYGPVACTQGMQTTVAALNVSAMDTPSCTLSVSPLDFGSQGMLRSYVDGTSSVQTACTLGTAYTVTFGAGNGPGATATQRYMTSGTNTLAYNIYTDVARSTVWSTTQGVHGTGTGATVNVPVYARIPAQSSPPPGVYHDQVVVTIAY